MLFELLELVYIYGTHEFLYWPFHLILFFIIANLVRNYLARGYKPYTNGLTRDKVKVSVVIPEYNEELNILEKVVSSAIENKPDEIILVIDDGRKEIELMVKKLMEEYKYYNISLVYPSKRLGKRGSLALAWMLAKGDIIVQLDSDSIMEKNTVEEIIKPFADPKVAGVQGHPLLYQTGGRIPFLLGQIGELARDVVCRMLDGFLVVIDGKIAAYRRDFLIKVMKDFLVEKWGNSRIVLADDRALTYLANKLGYKTVYQSTAYVRSAAQPTLVKYLKQQLRWVRSGYMYLIKDIKTGLFFQAPWKYRFQEIMYLMSPVSFTVAWVQTFLADVKVIGIAKEYIALVTGLDIPGIVISILIFIIGIGLTFEIGYRLLGVDKSEIKKLRISFLEQIYMGIIGLFLLYPVMLYAMITYKNVTDWLTR